MDEFEYIITKEKIDRLKTQVEVRSMFNSLKYEAGLGEYYEFKAATHLISAHTDKIVIGRNDHKLLVQGLGYLKDDSLYALHDITEFCDTVPVLTAAHLATIIRRADIPYQTAAHLLNSAKVIK